MDDGDDVFHHLSPAVLSGSLPHVLRKVLQHAGVSVGCLSGAPNPSSSSSSSSCVFGFQLTGHLEQQVLVIDHL